MNTKQTKFLQRHTNYSEETIKIYSRILTRLRKYSRKDRCLDITVDDIDGFIASLPGSMKPQAFSVIRTVYGRVLKSRMSEEFQRRIEWYDKNTPKQAKVIRKSELKYSEVVCILDGLSPTLRLLGMLILNGIRISEGVNIIPSDVSPNIIQLDSRQWNIPENLKKDVLFWSDVAKRREENVFPKTAATYSAKFRNVGLSASEIRRTGIEHAFDIGCDAYVFRVQFGITSDVQMTKYWKMYGDRKNSMKYIFGGKNDRDFYTR